MRVQYASGSVVECLTRDLVVAGERHCVVSLSKMLGTGLTQEDPSRRELKKVDQDVKNHSKRSSEKGGN